MFGVYLLAAVLAYLIGSFPTGYIAARTLAGIDVRQIGSGRTGGSNVYRSAGGKAGLATVIGDALKGLAGVGVARLLWEGDPVAVALAALFVVIGHNHSIFLRFKGGAGTITGVAALLGLHPILFLLAIIIPITMTYITRMTSIGSILVSAIALLLGAVLIWQQYLPVASLLFLLGFFLLSWSTHWPNITRLQAGTERRLGERTRS